MKSLEEITSKYDIRMKLSCCTHYNSSEYQLGYLIFPVFKAAKCKNCGAIQLICNPFLQKIFKIFFAPFWNKEMKEDEGYCIDTEALTNNQCFIIDGDSEETIRDFLLICKGISPNKGSVNSVYVFSTDEIIQLISSVCGWRGKLDENFKNFYKDLSPVLNNTPWGNTSLQMIKAKMSEIHNGIILIKINEKDDIKEYANYFNAKTVVIANDDKIYDSYDIIVNNAQSLSDLKCQAEIFMLEAMSNKINLMEGKETSGKFAPVFYI